MKRRGLFSWRAFLGEVEIWALLILCAVWFFLNLDGALDCDEFLKTSGTRFLLFGGPVANLNHPPLGKIFMGIGYLVFGKSSVGWRVVTPFFALGTIYLTYKIGVLLKGRAVGFLASLALAFTHLFATHAVMAMLDIYLAFFVILLLFLILSYFRKMEFLSTKDERLYLLCIGAASCSVFLSKYYGLFFIAAAYLVLLWEWRREAGPAEGREGLSILDRHKFYLIGHGLVAQGTSEERRSKLDPTPAFTHFDGLGHRCATISTSLRTLLVDWDFLRRKCVNLSSCGRIYCG